MSAKTPRLKDIAASGVITSEIELQCLLKGKTFLRDLNAVEMSSPQYRQFRARLGPDVLDYEDTALSNLFSSQSDYSGHVEMCGIEEDGVDSIWPKFLLHPEKQAEELLGAGVIP